MKYLFFILLITFLFTSCLKEAKENICFEYVDVSLSDAWIMKTSIRLDSSKVAHVLVDKLGEGKTYYIGKINDSIFCEINSLIKSALENEYDSIIGHPIPDGSISGIIIKANKKTAIKTLIFNDEMQTKLDTIIQRLNYLNNYKLSKITDTTFISESYELITPKRGESIQFVPPLIKEDKIER